MNLDWDALGIFLVLLVLVAALGFASAHWRRGDLGLLEEWGLGGRRFGTAMSWFLMGADFFTASAMIAIPALVYGAGATGAFGTTYCVFIFPIIFVFAPRLWSVCRRRGYVTAADFVRGRHGNRWLASAVALTGIVATMPYIALQLVGIQVVLAAMGLQTTGFSGDLPLIIAFVVLAAFTYTSGLRGPASIAVVKDILLYAAGAAAVVAIPIALGGIAGIFKGVPMAKLILAPPGPGTLGSYSTYVTLGIGSALGWGLYPHSVTGLLSARSRITIQRNAMLLPLYTIVISAMALMGYMAISAGVAQLPQFAAGFRQFGSTFAVPALFLQFFPGWFVGLTFAGLAIGALVPAGIMSIAAANLFSRNLYKEFVKPNCTPQQETAVAKWMSLVVKFGALAIIIVLPRQYMVNLQLIGSVAIVQTLPAVFLALYTRWFNPWALLAGWCGGILAGFMMLLSVSFKTPFYVLTVDGFTIPGYGAIFALAANLAVAVAGTLVLNLVRDGSAAIEDETVAIDYIS
jgi:SSS family solute:Na+ symporter